MLTAGLRLWQVLIGVAILALAQAVVWSPAAPVGLKAGIVTIAVLAWWRPAIALLVVAALVPFGRMFTVVWIDAFPVRGGEAVALAFLAGTWLHAMLPGRTRSEPLPLRKTLPWLLLAALVVASAAVTYRIFQIQQDLPGVFFGRLLAHVATDYHGPPGDVRPWSDTAGFRYVDAAILVLQGIALMFVTARITAHRPTLAKPLVAVMVVAGCGAALLSLQALLSAALATGNFFGSLPSLIVGQRWAEHVTKVNSAGSYFVLVAPLAVGLAIWDRRFRIPWLFAGATIVAALVLTGSMAALLPAILVAVVAAATWFAGRRTAASSHSRVTTATVLVVCLVPLVFAAVRVMNRPNAFGHLGDRVGLGQASLRMAADRPVFGFGIGQYPLESEIYVPEEVRAKFDLGPLQPHNYAIQLLTELGPAGVFLFAWGVAVLGAGLRTRSETLRSPDGWPVAIGVTLFLTSALAGQPLILDSVALPFWIVMGVLMSRSAGGGEGLHLHTLLVAGIALIALTMPFRMAREVERIDLTHVVYGAPERSDPNRERVRVLTGSTRFFLPVESAAFEIETYVAGDTGDVVLDLDVAGQTIPALAVASGRWHPTCVDLPRLPAPSGRFRPVDVTPATPSGGTPTGPVLVALFRGVGGPCNR